MSQQEIPFSQMRSLWFAKMSGIYQPILPFPLIGFVSTYQALIIFGLGLPSLFVVMSVTGQIYYGVIPLALFTVFSMIRPPVLSYEARLFSILMFYARGNRTINGKKKRSKKELKSNVLLKPSSPSAVMKKPSKVDMIEPLPDVVEKMTIPVSPNELRELSITLKNRDEEPIRRRKVRILIDGTLVMVDRSSKSGEVFVTLTYDDCIGTRKISIVDADGENIIAEREITFIRE